jgi:hypothetical protein
MNISKWLGISAGLIAMALPVTAFSQISPDSATRVQKISWQDRDDQRRRDDDDDRRNGQYGNYGQYGNRGYGQYGRGGQYQGVLAPEWQSKFDSYYQRWLQYRATNNQDEIASMEKRMQDIMRNYHIPSNVPYGAVASPGVAGNNGGYYGRGGYGRRGDDDADDRGYGRGVYGNNGGYGNGGYYGNGRNGYHSVLAPEWQSKFDSYYQRWLNYRATNNQGEVASMEKRMQDIMRNYHIPSNVPYGAVASPGVGGNRY